MAAKRAEPVAPVDNAWLRMEDPTNLMMITGVFIFDQVPDATRLRQVLEERMLRYARFRQRLTQPNGAYHWSADPHFDLRYHLRRIALPAPHDQAALQELVSDLMSTPLDFARPLWQFHLVENYKSGCALICRVHHSIADGIALVKVLLSITDTQPDAAPASAEPPEAPQPRGMFDGLVAPLQTAASQTLKLAGRVAEGLANPQALDLSKPVAVAAALGKLGLLSPDTRTLFKGRLGVAKRAAWSQHIPVEQVKQVGRVMGGTINDVLLTAASGALRRYLLGRGVDVAGLNIRAAVPVNLRPEQEVTTLGNRFGLVFLALPLGVAEPVERLIVLKERMEAIKNSAEAVVTYGILTTIGSLPAAAQDAVVELFGSKATAVMTNVPGPRQQLFLAGAAIENLMFWVPQSGRLGLGVSIFSYNGNVLLGIASDTGLVPDPEAIVAEFHQEFDALSELAQPV